MNIEVNLLDFFPIPTYIFDINGNYLEVFGCNKKLKGENIKDFFSEKIAQSILDKIRDAIKLKDKVKLRYSLDNNNNLEWYEAHIQPYINEDGIIDKVIFSKFSITDLKNELLELTLEKESLKKLAMKDDVTGLYNRRCFYTHVENSFNELKEKKLNSLSILLVDIDNFKGINDGFGHLVGDSVIIDLSTRILKNCKGKGYFARFGGDEFIVALENHNLSEGTTFAEYLRKSIEKHQNHSLPKYTISIGVSEVDIFDEKLSEGINRADEMLYYAKNSGKNKVLHTMI